jgi:hypothetical protein
MGRGWDVRGNRRESRIDRSTKGTSFWGAKKGRGREGKDEGFVFEDP